MAYLSQLLASLVAAPVGYGAFKLFQFFYAQWTSPLHILPSPPNSSFIYGNMKEIWKAVCTILPYFLIRSYHDHRIILSCTKSGSMNMGPPLHTGAYLEYVYLFRHPEIF